MKKKKPILTSLCIALDIELEDGLSLVGWLIEKGYGGSAQEAVGILSNIADDTRLERLREEGL
jgi:hypothetical protein